MAEILSYFIRLNKRAFYAFFVQGSFRTKMILLCSFVCLLMLIGFVLGVLLFDMSLGEAVFWAWTHIMDPGFIGDDRDSPMQAVVGSGIAIIGLVAVGGTLISLASDLALSKLDLLRRGRVPANLKNHTIVIGSGGMIDAVVNKLIQKIGADEKHVVIVFPVAEELDHIAFSNTENLHCCVENSWSETVIDRLKMDHADRIIVFENGVDNLAQMMQIFMLVSERRKALLSVSSGVGNELKIYGEVNDSEILTNLRSSLSQIKGTDQTTEINLLNMTELCARLALRQHPLDRVPIGQHDDNKVVFVIYGWNPLAQALLWQSVKIAHYQSKPTRLIIISEESNDVQKTIQKQAPGLLDARYASWLMTIETSDFLADNLWGEQDSVTVALCGGNVDRVFSRALSLRQKGWPGLKQILVELPDGAGYRELIENLVSPIPLHAIGSHSEAFELAESLDHYARQAHERYLKSQSSRPQQSDGGYVYPNHNDWNHLNEHLRNANRATMDHRWIKLHVLADRLNVQRPTHSDSPELSSTLREQIQMLVHHVDENRQELNVHLEALASLEHDRWSGEKIAEGWVYGEIKNVSRKQTPYLVRYDELSEEVKHWDRIQVRTQLATFVDEALQY